MGHPAPASPCLLISAGLFCPNHSVHPATSSTPCCLLVKPKLLSLAFKALNSSPSKIPVLAGRTGRRPEACGMEHLHARIRPVVLYFHALAQPSFFLKTPLTTSLYLYEQEPHSSCPCLFGQSFWSSDTVLDSGGLIWRGKKVTKNMYKE